MKNRKSFIATCAAAWAALAMPNPTLAQSANGAQVNGEYVVAQNQTSQVEIIFWQSVQNSTSPADFQAYLTRYPNGAFAVLARNKMAQLASAADAAAAQQAAAKKQAEMVGARWRRNWTPDRYEDGYTEIVYSGDSLVATDIHTRDDWSDTSMVGRPYVNWRLALDGNLLGKTFSVLKKPDSDCQCDGQSTGTISEDGNSITLKIPDSGHGPCTLLFRRE